MSVISEETWTKDELYKIRDNNWSKKSINSALDYLDDKEEISKYQLYFTDKEKELVLNYATKYELFWGIEEKEEILPTTQIKPKNLEKLALEEKPIIKKEVVKSKNVSRIIERQINDLIEPGIIDYFLPFVGLFTYVKRVKDRCDDIHLSQSKRIFTVENMRLFGEKLAK